MRTFAAGRSLRSDNRWLRSVWICGGLTANALSDPDGRIGNGFARCPCGFHFLAANILIKMRIAVELINESERE